MIKEDKNNKYEKTKESDLVRTSRAGDAFHYRWAARFCLKMIKPNSNITSVNIEQSREKEEPGENVMDMSVYYENDGNISVEYYQMKHSTKSQGIHLTLSKIKKTIEGFADRYKSNIKAGLVNTKYIVITNRCIDTKLLEAISKISRGEDANKRIKNLLISYTELSEDNLRDFCRMLILKGNEDNYEEQFYKLIGETGKLVSNIDNTDIINRLITMIQARVLPNNRTEITKATVLNQFGCTSERDLYPAPSEFEELDNVLHRDEYKRLAEEIKRSDKIKVITAIGGLGKSIFTNMLPNILGEENLTITYDCFGNGTYRNRLKFRHRHKDALVQIANELANKGLCELLIPTDNDIDRISAAFQERISDAVNRFRKTHPTGKLVIAVDAADNAEMVAKDNSDIAFPSDVIQQGLPDNCILVMLCRPERMNMLNIRKDVVKLKIKPFSINETKEYVSKKISDISYRDVEAIHKLTNGNPRVISIAMQKSKCVQDIMNLLGPKPITVDEQIKMLLEQAVSKVIENLSDNFQEEMNNLFCGLSVLPPNIPVIDLSVVTGVSEDAIKSFVSEMGAQIIISDEHLHFRDEPTESWFRETYKNDKTILNRFIGRIEPLTSNSPYLASALPEIYVQAGHYEKMIEVVANEQYLPNTTESDMREVEYIRLRYAVKAAINSDCYKDLIKLGLMAGDRGEIHNRIYKFYQENFDVLYEFLSEEPLSELAYKGILKGKWAGSDRLFTAVLLSQIENNKAEASVYIRRAEEFLHLYFEERRNKEKPFYQELLTDDDVFAFVLSVYNISGLDESIEFIGRCTSDWLIFRLSRKLSAYLIDISKIDEVVAFLNKSKDNIFCTLGITLELDRIGFNYDCSFLEKSIEYFTLNNLKLPDNYLVEYEDAAPKLSVVNFCEKLFISGYKDKCKETIEEMYTHIDPSKFISSSYYNYKRVIYLRIIALKKKLDTEFNFFEHEYFYNDKDQHTFNGNKGKVKGIYEQLYPWYNLRLDVLTGEKVEILEKAVNLRKTVKNAYSGQYDRFHTKEKEIYNIIADIILNNKWKDEKEAKSFISVILDKENNGMPKDRINLLRGLMRKYTFDDIIHNYENEIYALIKVGFDEPSEKVNMLMNMARALLGYNRRDAQAYFKEAVTENERFGEDLPHKWRAIESIGRIASLDNEDKKELSYRFIRSAEFVGEHVEREKYWNRNEAVRIATLLSPSQGLAAISRWRERDVGWIEDQLPNIFEALQERNALSSSQLWGLSGFFPNNSFEVVNLAAKAIQKSQNDKEKKDILRQVNKIASIKGYSIENCDNLRKIKKELSCFDQTIYPGRNIYYKDIYQNASKKDINDDQIEILLDNWEYNGNKSIQKIFDILDSIGGLSYNNNYYWKCITRKVDINKYDYFLEDILSIQSKNLTNIIKLLSIIPDQWRERRGFEGFWGNYLKKIGRVYSYEILDYYYIRTLEKQGYLSKDDLSWIFKGCMETYKKANSEFTSLDYYKLAAISSIIEKQETSIDSLDFALKMLEKDMDVDFADGPPEDLPIITNDFGECYSAYFKAALASPECEVRWQAVHGIVRYGLIVEENEFINMINNMYSIEIEAFLGKGFKFYDLNFQLYLIIALQRISLEQPQKLIRIKDILMQYFENDFTHALIQLGASNIVYMLEKYSNGLFSTQELEVVKSSFQSSDKKILNENIYSIEKSDKYSDFKNKNEYHAALDFDRYWLDSLEKMFNIPVKDIEKLIGNYISEKMDIKLKDNSWVVDNRSYVFRKNNFSGKTYTSHGAHPLVENLSFYISYHIMFIIAGRFIKEEPLYIYENYDDTDNPYLSWLKDKFLSREDGYFLIDGRTSMPVNLPKWYKKSLKDDWLKNVDEEYLIDNILNGKDICLKGYWGYKKNEYKEIITIESVLVDKDKVTEVIDHLISLKPHDYYLGRYEEIKDINNKTIKLEEWIANKDIVEGLDKHDPWAKGTIYPDYEIGGVYLDKLNIKKNNMGTEWINIEDGTISAYNENWVVDFGSYNDTYLQHCHRIFAKKEMLVKLCSNENKSIIVNIKIDRERVKDRYMSISKSERYSYHAFIVIDDKGLYTYK
jgi:hypothetical protein